MFRVEVLFAFSIFRNWAGIIEFRALGFRPKADGCSVKASPLTLNPTPYASTRKPKNVEPGRQDSGKEWGPF